MRIGFDKIDGFIKIYGATKHLVLLSYEKYDVIYNRNRYIMRLKSGITYIYSHYFMKIKVNSNLTVTGYKPTIT